MSFGIHDGRPGPGFWERDNSHFPLPMSRHLWELFMPPYDEGTRRGLARYGSLIQNFDFARVKGRLYLRTRFVEDPAEREARIRASEHALTMRLWRRDRDEWQGARSEFYRRLLRFSDVEPGRLDPAYLKNHIGAIRQIFVEGALRHFVQQPSSMFPVGDWVRSACAWTGCTGAEALSLLIGSHSGAAELLGPLDRRNEHVDRVITGFDIIDLTLRELPQLHAETFETRSEPWPRPQSAAETAEREALLRERTPEARREEFDAVLREARAAYGLHDEDVRITYLWPLGLLRRATLAAAGRLIDEGRLGQSDHVFQTTPAELDALLDGSPAPSPVELAQRMEEFVSWKDEKPPPSFGEKEPADFAALPESCLRVNEAIMFYLGQMEDPMSGNSAGPSWSLMVAGLAASPGRYEGWARVVRQPSDFRKLRKGDVLVAPTTSPAYNVILPIIGAVVTDRGGALSHCAIVAREFGIPAVVGADQATSRIPDGARILVDGDRGFVAVQA
jgi:pyruvate,water dikinase